MIKRGIKTAAIFAAYLAVSVTAFAAPIDKLNFDEATQVLTVQGSISPNTASYLNDITLQVLKPGKAGEDLKNITPSYWNDIIAHQDQVTPDVNGNYTYSCHIDSVQGTHLVRVFLTNSTVPYTDSFVYIDKKMADSLIRDINIAVRERDINKMKTIFTEYDVLLSEITVYKELQAADPEKTFLDNVAKGMLTYDGYTTTEQVIECFERELLLKKAVGLSAQDLPGFLDSNAAKLGFADQPIYTQVFRKILSGAQQIEFCRGIAGQAYESMHAFEKDFFDKVILYSLRQMNNYVQVRPMLEHCETYLQGFNFEGYLSSDLTNNQRYLIDTAILEGKNADTIAELKQIFNNAIRQVENTPDKQPSGNNGGGGGSGGDKYNTSVFMPQTQPPANTPEAEKTEAFSDLDSVYWAKESIEALYHAGIISGNGDGTFAPEKAVTRAEFTKMLILAFDLLEEDAACSFSDVSRDDWSYPYVASAQVKGITAGYDNGMFGGGDLISRQDLATLAYRVILDKAKITPDTSKYEPFSDDTSISEYAQEGVYAMKNSGVIQGREKNCFAPKENATRAEAAKILFGLINLQK
ncbi:MAG: S-layer homology domain-containing protein [Clostridia bacterium]|nr:S-layer homology domain-containing protein [Clostridia bacterium]